MFSKSLKKAMMSFKIDQLKVITLNNIPSSSQYFIEQIQIQQLFSKPLYMIKFTSIKTPNSPYRHHRIIYNRRSLQNEAQDQLKYNDIFTNIDLQPLAPIHKNSPINIFNQKLQSCLKERQIRELFYSSDKKIKRSMDQTGCKTGKSKQRKLLIIQEAKIAKNSHSLDMSNRKLHINKKQQEIKHLNSQNRTVNKISIVNEANSPQLKFKQDYNLTEQQIQRGNLLIQALLKRRRKYKLFTKPEQKLTTNDSQFKKIKSLFKNKQQTDLKQDQDQQTFNYLPLMRYLKDKIGKDRMRKTQILQGDHRYQNKTFSQQKSRKNKQTPIKEMKSVNLMPWSKHIQEGEDFGPWGAQATQIH